MKIEKSIKSKADITELQTNTHVISIQINSFKGFPGNLVVKNPPAMQENGVLNLIWEDPLEKEMAIYSRILTWEIPWTEEPVSLQFMGQQKNQTQFSD